MSVFYDYLNSDKNLPKDELLYDEFPFIIEGNVYNIGQTSFPNLINWSINYKHGTKHYPHRNSMKMQPREYLEFLSQFTKELNKDKNIINSIV